VCVYVVMKVTECGEWCDDDNDKMMTREEKCEPKSQ